MMIRVLISIIGTLAGGWMVFDGMHVMVRGKYFGPEKPGPWSELLVRMGVEPRRLGPLFVVLGILWLVFLVAWLLGARWGWYGAVFVAIASLWYLPVGTALAVVYLVLLWISRA